MLEGAISRCSLIDRQVELLKQHFVIRQIEGVAIQHCIAALRPMCDSCKDACLLEGRVICMCTHTQKLRVGEHSILKCLIEGYISLLIPMKTFLEYSHPEQVIYTCTLQAAEEDMA